MLGHLVSNSRQDAPDFGMASWLRKTGSGLQRETQRLVSLLLHAAPPRKQPAHPR
jgi:hypothetical protein